MSQHNPRLVYLDGFAGPGTYSGDEYGSPLVAIKALIEHSQFRSFASGTEYVFAFWEADPERYEDLEYHLDAYRASLGGSWPSGVKVLPRRKAFSDAATEVLAESARIKRDLAPTFAFVDPFGVTGLPMALLSRLAAFPKVELFVNMMMNTARRFASSGQIDESLGELFGTDDYKAAEGLTGRARIDYLHELYGQQLRQRCGLTHVQSFEMVNKGGHTSYFLYYGTHSLTGLRKMKEAMWKADPGGGYNFSDRLAGQDVLFEGDGNAGVLRADLIRVFSGQTVSVETLEHHVLTNTPFRETHLRKVLGPLENEAAIEVHRAPKARQFPPGTTITFRPKLVVPSVRSAPRAGAAPM